MCQEKMDNLQIDENGQGEEASPYLYDSAEENEKKGTCTIFLSDTTTLVHNECPLWPGYRLISYARVYCRKRRRKTKVEQKGAQEVEEKGKLTLFKLVK